MREIIQLQLGQCGNQIGTRFWEKICHEHEIESDGCYTGKDSENDSKRIGVYFSHVAENRYVPRSINIDLEPGTMETLKASEFGRIYRPDNTVYGNTGTGNNWAKGHWTDGAELESPIMEVLRKEVEQCDCLQAFQFAHSIGGGTGSGLGTLILKKIKEEYSDRLNTSFSIIPSPKVSDTVVEPYNAVLSLALLIESTDMTYCLDNEALYTICNQSLKLENPGYGDLNGIVSTAMAGITTCLRFPGQLNADVRKMATNMIPFPRMHFLVSSVAPIGGANEIKYRAMTVPDLTSQLFDNKNMMVACTLDGTKVITAATIFRGSMSIKEVEDEMMALENSSNNRFVDWIPDNIKTAVCDVTPKDSPMSATMMANSTGISSVLARICDQFDVMLNKKAFLHWYTNEGMEVADFTTASEAMRDIISLYSCEECQDQTPKPQE